MKEREKIRRLGGKNSTQYMRQTKKVRSDHCWTWLENGDRKSYSGSSESEYKNKSR